MRGWGSRTCSPPLQLDARGAAIGLLRVDPGAGKALPDGSVIGVATGRSVGISSRVKAWAYALKRWEFDRVADRYPVFRIEPVADQG